ncbi:MAG: GNAT family N-acetyltransferase [Silvibacterium sp.]|nr:GNAT family N-acetyltransferase [Silvibacterium sp.]
MADVRPLAESDLSEAQRIVRRAFGTFLGAPDLDNFWTDLDYVYGRFGAEHIASFAADRDGELAGVNFATNWGSIGFFGPICVRPDLWNSGIAQPLVEAACRQFDRWGTKHAGLCTFPHSTKHVWLYQKFGFYPRYLTMLMAAPVSAKGAGSLPPDARYSALSSDARRQAEEASRAMAEEVFEGLDLRGEIRTATARNLGDTLLVWDSSGRLAAFAVCHWGPASEAGEGCLYIKFAAVRPGPKAADHFAALLDAAGALARSVGMVNVLAGVNTSREEAYRQMLARAFRSRIHLIIMHRPNEPGYCRPGVFVLDDWR